VLQAADILLYQTNEVPVGEDQRQHLELSRDLAVRFNHRYGPTFQVPSALILSGVAKITDLQEPTAKMRKSYSSAAAPYGSEPDDREDRPGGPDPAAGPRGRVGQAGVTNLLRIYSALTGADFPALENGTRAWATAVQKDLAEVVMALAPIRERTEDARREAERTGCWPTGPPGPGRSRRRPWRGPGPGGLPPPGPPLSGTRDAPGHRGREDRGADPAVTGWWERPPGSAGRPLVALAGGRSDLMAGMLRGGSGVRGWRAGAVGAGCAAAA
jgi:hypothetical protein